MKPDDSKFSTIPVGKLGIIAMQSCSSLGKKVDKYLVKWRRERKNKEKGTLAFNEYQRDSYLLDAKCPRFGSGEAKALIQDSVRGVDLYILVDVLNYSIQYSLCGRTNSMSPDDHYQDLKRIISATGNKTRNITVIMPYLYEGRQHRRSSRESLDCALALQELNSMGVNNIITFDAHDPRVQNAIPSSGFDNIMPTYQFVKALLKSTDDLQIDPDHMMIISPDEGAMQRAIYFSNVLEVDIGMFYKRRDYSVIVDGRNPIICHEFLGDSVEGKDVLIVDDMISSGDSMMDVARELKRRKAKRVFCIATFGLFTSGLEKFDQCHQEGVIEKVLTTNLTYQTSELLSRNWYVSCDMSKYIAILIESINHDTSISALLDPTERIKTRIEEYKVRHTITEEES